MDHDADMDPLVIHAYPGFGTARELRVRGRVLDEEGLGASVAGASVWTHLRDAWRRFETDERAGVPVRALFQGQVAEARTDDEGYFDLAVPVVGPLPADRSWHDVKLEVAGPQASEPLATAVCPVLVPGSRARLAVISDIDDTVIQTGATQLLKAARGVLLGSAHTRVPFPGVAAFYRALEVGGDGDAVNPFFYVSSSPWNLYDVLLQVMALHHIPAGPLFLRDWGLAREGLPFGHRVHKLAAIRHVARLYPELPLLLVGDSGQEDPEIYHEVVGLFPGRVRAIYIRNVVPAPDRVAAIRALAEQVLAAGSALVLAEDTVAAARHAAEHGWIGADRLTAIVAGKEADKPPERAAAVEDTVVIAPGAPAAARAALDAGVVEAALEPPAGGEKTPAVIVESPAAASPGAVTTGGGGDPLL